MKKIFKFCFGLILFFQSFYLPFYIGYKYLPEGNLFNVWYGFGLLITLIIEGFGSFIIGLILCLTIIDPDILALSSPDKLDEDYPRQDS